MDFFEDDEPVEKVVEAFGRGEKKHTRPSLKFRAFHALDAVAHFLHCPTMLGRRSARYRWHHNIHLIPGFALAWICDRYELAMGVTPEELRRDRQDAADADEAMADPSPRIPMDSILARYAERPLPSGYACPHGSIGISSNATLSNATCGHGCTMQPVYA